MGGIDEAGSMETSSLATQAPMAATCLKENFGFPRLRTCRKARASGVLAISVCLVLSLQAEQGAQGHPQSQDPPPSKITKVSTSPAANNGIASLRLAVRNSPSSPSAHLNLAVALSEAGAWAEARAEFQTALKLKPKDPLTVYNLGLNDLRAAQGMGSVRTPAYYELLESAQTALLQAVALNPRLPKIHQHLGWLYHQIGDQSSAVEEFRKGADAEPDSPEAYNNLGTALAESQEYDQAITAYEKAFALAPESVSTAINLDGAVRRGGKKVEALHKYEALVASEPGSPPDHLLYGLALYWNDRREQSLSELRAAVEKNPKLAVARFYIAKILHEQNRNEEAEAECKRAIALAPGRADFIELSAILLYDQGQITEAESALRQGLALKPDESSLHYQLGRVLQRRNQPQEAAREFAEASRLKQFASMQGQLAMELSRGILQLRAGNFPAAVQTLQSAHALDPDYPEANYYLGIALSQVGDAEGSTRAFENALRRRPTSAEIHYNFGIALWQHDEPVRAITELRGATVLRPDYGVAHCALGMALLRTGHVEEGQSEIARSRNLGACVSQSDSAPK